MHFWDEHKTITRYYEMKVSGVCEKYQLRQLEYDILMFIYWSSQNARDFTHEMNDVCNWFSAVSIREP